LNHLQPLHDRWESGLRCLKGADNVLRYRVALSGIALGLGSWLAFVADKPWRFDLTQTASWNLAKLVGFYSFWAGTFNLGLLGILIWTAPWWAGGEVRRKSDTRPRSFSRFFWIGVIGAMTFLGSLASQRLDFGLAHDEDLSARRAIVGEYILREDGSLLPPELRWRNTFFDYRKPTNHVLYSVLARSAWTAWRVFAPAGDWQISEWVVRLPAWLAGISALLVLAVLVAKIGGDLAGVTSAWLLALHPWFLRYSSEARGYSLLLLLLPGMLLFWLRATRENLWRWWLGFGACQFLVLWVYPAAIYILIILNSLTAWWLIRESIRQPGDIRFRRWLAANLMAAIAATQAILPLVPQFLNYLKTAPEARQPLTRSWLIELSSNLLVGTGWNKSASLDSPYVELAPQANQHPIVFACLLALLAVAIVTGIVRATRWMWPQGIIVVLTLLAPAATAAAVAKASNQWLFEWYLIYLLPGLVALAAIGICGNREPSLQLPWRVIAAFAVLLIYAGFSEPIRSPICNRPFDPIKQVAMSMRGTLKPTAQSGNERLTASFPNHLSYYDPHAQRLKTPADLQKMMQRADSEQKPLYVSAYHPWGAVFGCPELWRLFYESGLFVDFAIHHGIENLEDRVVARYQPGALAEFDIEEFLRGKHPIPNPLQPPKAYVKKSSRSPEPP
jgi:4-amino-4-deoxy-L-arabinose transferase-like glycosyltransferase